MAKKILIVDDASYLRLMAKDILTKYGYEIIGEAENGEDAVAKYQALRPDLVTMDIVMQIKSGIDAIKEIVKIDPGARIIVVSALGQQSMIVDAIQAGAKGFVTKPFKPEVLLGEVRRILGEK